MTDSIDIRYDMGYDLYVIFEENMTSKALMEEMQLWVVEEELPHLSNDMLALFLITNDNDIEATKTNMIKYLETREDAPEIFDNRYVDSTDVVKATNTVLMVYSPIRTQDNCSVLIFKLMETDPKRFDLISILKLLFMIMDLSLMQHPPMGLHSIIDMKGSGVMHLTHFSLQILKKFFHYAQDGLPLPMRNVHVINTNVVFHRVLGLSRIFLKDAVLKRIRVQKPETSIKDFLTSYISPQCLPQEYGGSLPTIPEIQITNIDELHAMTSYFVAEEKTRKTPGDCSRKYSTFSTLSRKPESETYIRDESIATRSTMMSVVPRSQEMLYVGEE